MSGYCSVSSSSRLKLPAVAKNKNNTKRHCCKTDMLEEKGISKGNVIDNLSAVTGECVVVLRCARNSLCVALASEEVQELVCVPHCLDRLFLLTQNERFVGQCSCLTLCFCWLFSTILAVLFP